MSRLNIPEDEYLEEKKGFTSWIQNWDKSPSSSCENLSIDAPELTLLLQSMGFKLDTFEKKTADPERKGLKVELSCCMSGMKATLAKDLDLCKCPSSEDASNAQFWNITGCEPATKGVGSESLSAGPQPQKQEHKWWQTRVFDGVRENIQENINVSNSSLLPSLSAPKNKAIGELMYKILNVINGTDQNQNNEIISITTPVITKPNSLLKQDTWEVDPKTSPPALTSSPLVNTTNSSILHTSDDSSLLNNKIHQMKKLLDEIAELANARNTTFTKKTTLKKRISDIKVSPSISRGTSAAGTYIEMKQPVSSPRITPSKNPTPKRSTTPRKSTTPKKVIATTGDRLRPPVSRLATLKRTSLGTGTPVSTNVKPRQDTPYVFKPNIINQNNLASQTGRNTCQGGTCHGARPKVLHKPTGASSTIVKKK